MTGISINFEVDSEVSKEELMESIANWEITVTTNSRMEFTANSSGTGTNINVGNHSSSLDAYGTQYDLMGRGVPSQLVLQNGMVLAHDAATDALSFTMQDAKGTNYKFSAGNVSVKTDNGANLTARNDIVSDKKIENIRYDSQLIAGDREMMIQAGPHSQQAIKIMLPAMNSAILGISGIDVTSYSSASAAITSASKAVEQVSQMRSHFGATQNRLEHAMAVNQINAENTMASESRIRDADMAEEMVENAKTNILIEAGQSILAQANRSPVDIIRGLLQ